MHALLELMEEYCQCVVYPWRCEASRSCDAYVRMCACNSHGVGVVTSEENGNVAILQLESVTYPGMWCLMNHLHGGPQKRKYYQIQMFLRMSCNLLESN